jgi:hypothetical protein
VQGVGSLGVWHTGVWLRAGLALWRVLQRVSTWGMIMPLS